MPEQPAFLRRHQAGSHRRGFRRGEEAKPGHTRISNGARLRPRRGNLHGLGGCAARHLHRETGLNVDVFADELYFCHQIPFKNRSELDSHPHHLHTDLLLEKMQIVEINLKDFKDTIVLMLEHPLSHQESGKKSIDTDYIADMMRQDWGFYHTFTTNLKRVPEHFAEFPSMQDYQLNLIRARIDELLTVLETSPKTLGWKMRAKVGTRARWYQEVSEKSHQF